MEGGCPLLAHKIIFVPILIIIAVVGNLSIAATRLPALEDSSAYLGVFIVDYTDSTFEGGALLKLPRNRGCDDLPLYMNYVPPLDFGSVTFFYGETNDTVFSGTIIWMGTGRITFPRQILPPDFFPAGDRDVPLPMGVKRFSHDPVTALDFDFALSRIQRLKIVDSLIRQGSHVGLYLYAPSVGAFDPRAAKVIVFIFRNVQNDVGIRNLDRGAGTRPSMQRAYQCLARNAGGGMVLKVPGRVLDLRGRRVLPLR